MGLTDTGPEAGQVTDNDPPCPSVGCPQSLPSVFLLLKHTQSRFIQDPLGPKYITWGFKFLEGHKNMEDEGFQVVSLRFEYTDAQR